MNDPGDENDRPSPHEYDRCAFCQIKLRARDCWRTPVLLYEPIWSAFEAAALDHTSTRQYEDLATCNTAVCRESARRFARAQGEPFDYKKSRAIIQARSSDPYARVACWKDLERPV